MTIETATHVSDLNTSYPASGDPKSEGDDHIRLIKTVVKTDVSTLSASASTTLSTVALVSTSLGNVSTSQGDISTSLSATASTVTAVSTSLGNVSTSLGNVSTSNANVSTSLSTNTSTLTAVSSTVAAAGTPAMAFVSSQTASASASITFTGFVSGYDYVIEADGVFQSATVGFNIRLRIAGVDTASIYEYALRCVDSSGTLSSVVATSGASAIALTTFDTNVNGAGTLHVYIKNPATALRRKYLRLVQASYPNDTYFNSTQGQIVALTGDGVAFDGITFYPVSGTITAGTFNLYKIARS